MKKQVRKCRPGTIIKVPPKNKGEDTIIMLVLEKNKCTLFGPQPGKHGDFGAVFDIGDEGLEDDIGEVLFEPTD